jgi:hypothetical protein
MKIAATATVALLMMGVAACGDEVEPASPGGPPSESPPTDDTGTASTEAGATVPYPEAARQSFLDACSAGAPLETCECAFQYFEENVPLDEFIDAGLNIAEGKEPPAAIMKATEECA